MRQLVKQGNGAGILVAGATIANAVGEHVRRQFSTLVGSRNDRGTRDAIHSR
jgi:hypothetical protein